MFCQSIHSLFGEANGVPTSSPASRSCSSRLGSTPVSRVQYFIHDLRHHGRHIPRLPRLGGGRCSKIRHDSCAAGTRHRRCGPPMRAQRCAAQRPSHTCARRRRRSTPRGFASPHPSAAAPARRSFGKEYILHVASIGTCTCTCTWYMQDHTAVHNSGCGRSLIALTDRYM